tara:strand:+ start:40 stop:252 length:213 start_codon:yes stop_codon:yes gene_type:complete
MNWTKGLLPMKCDNILNISSLKTDVIFIMKCCVKKTIKKTPDKAIAIFLPIEDLKIFFIYNFIYYKINLE